MQASHDSEIFVETPTEYEDADLDCDQPLCIHIGRLSRERATYICQQLSLFLEDHDTDAYARALSILTDSVDDPRNAVIEIETPSDEPEDCFLPIEVEIEDISSDMAHEIVDKLNQLIANPDQQANAIRLCELLAEATSNQPRSIVRLVQNDGSRRTGLEWHTDTSAEQDPL